MTLALDLKSTRLNALLLPLKSRDITALHAAADAQWAGAFDGEPLLLDLRALPDDGDELPWPTLLGLLRGHGLQPLGLLGAARLREAERASAQAAGLALLPEADEPASGGNVARPAPAAAPAAPAAPAEAPRCMVIDRPLRSGQKVYARDADLVVLGLVSHGAEVIADGHIHVYGALRGRAVAGARGRSDARIYAQSLEAELVSVAGTFRTSEKPLPPEVLAKPAQVRLDGERLVFEPLKY